jgi:predicted RecA/RadA family phage recombinase
MAKNKVQDGDILKLTNTTAGAAKSAGDPICEGNITGICQVDIADAAAGAVDTKGVYNKLVKGVDGSGNKAIGFGDAVYYDGGDLNVDSTNGTLFGYALGAVVSGVLTTLIDVKLK